MFGGRSCGSAKASLASNSHDKKSNAPAFGGLGGGGGRFSSDPCLGGGGGRTSFRAAKREDYFGVGVGSRQSRWMQWL